MKNKSITNALLFLAGIGAFTTAYLTMQGTIQQYIPFQDPLNELGFCVITLLLGAICVYSSFTKTTPN